MANLIKRGKKKKGFTLVELVAVVAIIGILAAILVPKISGYIREAKKTAVIDQTRKVSQAIDAYRMKGGKALDTAAGDLDSTKTVAAAVAIDSICDLAAGTTSDTDALGASGALNKIPGTMTLKDCYDIVNQNADFTVTDKGVWKANTSLATS
ncbi:type II secretion system protein [Clostridium chrysemydis]|uniref:type II secretion system protein n=1 Tax=Clostridium chrysemydis TaxID=2665504 RepID=UPI003F3D8AD4